MGDSEDWTLIREQVRQRDKYTCQRCGAKGSEYNLQVHHIVPRAEGGSDQLDNLVTLCEACHDEIHTGTTDGKIAKYTGEEFREWIEEYNGSEKTPWDSEYICINCGHKWVGKPFSERTSQIQCSNQDCKFSSKDVCIEVGELYIPIGTLKRILKRDEPLNYTGIELKQPIKNFTPDKLFAYYSDFFDQFLPYIVYLDTKAPCDKCGTQGATNYTLKITSDILKEPIEDSVLLCDDCVETLSSNDEMHLE